MHVLSMAACSVCLSAIGDDLLFWSSRRTSLGRGLIAICRVSSLLGKDLVICCLVQRPATDAPTISTVRRPALHSPDLLAQSFLSCATLPLCRSPPAPSRTGPPLAGALALAKASGHGGPRRRDGALRGGAGRRGRRTGSRSTPSAASAERHGDDAAALCTGLTPHVCRARLESHSRSARASSLAVCLLCTST